MPGRRSNLVDLCNYPQIRYVVWAMGMTAQRTLTVRGIADLLRRAGSDTLVRSSVFMMATTVVTAGLGYVFWAFAAHAFTKQEVGIGSAVISLCSTVALLTYLGSSAMLIERLPANEHSSAWTAVLMRICLATAGVTVTVMVAIVPVLRVFGQYRPFFGTVLSALLAVAGAAAWTVVNLFGATFIAARRAGGLLSMQTLISAVKILLTSHSRLPEWIQRAWWELGLQAPWSACVLEPYGSFRRWSLASVLVMIRAGERMGHSRGVRVFVAGRASAPSIAGRPLPQARPPSGGCLAST